jgi:hypothetical integral membrane protein (TIGR02206 family)
MDTWFDRGDHGFVAFGWEHLLSLFLVFFGVYMMYGLKSRLTESSALKRFFISGLLLSEISYQYWAFFNGMWDVNVYLPLQLCSLNILLSILLLITENKKLFAFVYLFGFTGALQALITPELFQQAWHFRFLQYFIAHSFIVWTAMYFAIVKGFRLSWRDFWHAFIWLNLYAGIVYVVNIVLDANYMFLLRKPSNPSLMDFMGPHPLYLIVLELMAFFLSLLVFLPVKEEKRKNAKHDRH